MVFVVLYLRSDFYKGIMVTSDTEFGRGNVASALTLAKKGLFVSRIICYMYYAAELVQLLLPPGVEREDCPEPGWVVVGGSQCGC